MEEITPDRIVTRLRVRRTPELGARVEHELMQVLTRHYGSMPLSLLWHAARTTRELMELDTLARPIPAARTLEQEEYRRDALRQAVRDGRCPCDDETLRTATVAYSSTGDVWTFEHTDGRKHDDRLNWRA